MRATERVRNAGKQDLVRQGELHQARGDRLDQALDLDRLGALGDIVGRVVPGQDVADVDADPRRERRAFLQPEFAQGAQVGQRERDGLHRALEHQQEAVGLVDFATAVGRHQRARAPVVLAQQFGAARHLADARHAQCVGQAAVTATGRAGGRRDVGIALVQAGNDTIDLARLVALRPQRRDRAVFAAEQLDDAVLPGQDHVARLHQVADLEDAHLAVAAADQGAAPQGGDSSGAGVGDRGHETTFRGHVSVA